MPLRAHELLRDVPLYDVSIVDLPGGGEGRTIADINALDKVAAPSRVSSTLYGARRLIGRLFGWDREMKLEDSYLSRLTERDLRESMIAPGTRNGAFVILYELAGENVAETRNATVHGFICTALQRTSTGYRFYLAVYVLPVSWLTRPYLIAIEPFRKILYPAMLDRIRRAWIATYGK
ncbi:MAG: DUF2867 domain-containing protein [Thermoanaerobaculia bacterium]